MCARTSSNAYLFKYQTYRLLWRLTSLFLLVCLLINETEISRRTATCDGIGERERKKKLIIEIIIPRLDIFVSFERFFFLLYEVVFNRIEMQLPLRSISKRLNVYFSYYFFSLFGLYFIEKVHLIIGYKTSQGNRKKCIFFCFENYYSFCKQMRIHFCACSQFWSHTALSQAQAEEVFSSLFYLKQNMKYFSRVEDIVRLSAWLRVDFACYAPCLCVFLFYFVSYIFVVVVAISKWRISSACYDRRSNL